MPVALPLRFCFDNSLLSWGNEMGNDKCYRITPEEVTWSNTDDGVFERELFQSDAVRLRQAQLPGSIQWSLTNRTLCLLAKGSLALQDGDELAAGDLYWSNSDGASGAVGPDGATLYCIEPLQDIGREIPSQKVDSSSIEWEQFDDPAGRPTQPVQVLLDGSLSALRTRFDPSYIAGEHWHDFDTLYFISDGRMQFGDEGWFEQGSIRAVHGGHSYGPERPGADGVEFVLISLGGPVALHWSDLEPPP